MVGARERLALMLVDIAVCWSDLPIASAMLMKLETGEAAAEQQDAVSSRCPLCHTANVPVSKEAKKDRIRRHDRARGKR